MVELVGGGSHSVLNRAIPSSYNYIWKVRTDQICLHLVDTMKQQVPVFIVQFDLDVKYRLHETECRL